MLNSLSCISSVSIVCSAISHFTSYFRRGYTVRRVADAGAIGEGAPWKVRISGGSDSCRPVRMLTFVFIVFLPSLGGL